MDLYLVTFITIIMVIFGVGIFLLMKFGRRPKKLVSVPNREMYSFRSEIINKLTDKNYLIREKENGDIFVQKDTFSSTTLVLEQNGSNVNVLFIHRNSRAFLVIFIILFLVFWIGALIIAVIADTNSKTFRENELKPLLSGHTNGRICQNCKRSIPIDSRICPYCGKQLL